MIIVVVVVTTRTCGYFPTRDIGSAIVRAAMITTVSGTASCNRGRWLVKCSAEISPGSWQRRRVSRVLNLRDLVWSLQLCITIGVVYIK